MTFINSESIDFLTGYEPGTPLPDLQVRVVQAERLKAMGGKIIFGALAASGFDVYRMLQTEVKYKDFTGLAVGPYVTWIDGEVFAPENSLALWKISESSES